MLKWPKLQLDEIASYEEQPIQILEANEHIFQGRTIVMFRVLWQHHGATETTWENESEMCEHYPHLFADQGIFQISRMKFLEGG